MATTVEDLYRQILGREPDAGGLAFWQNAFGGSVDPTEQASFMQAAQAELANRTPAEQAALAPKLVANSGVALTPPAERLLGGSVQTTPVVPTLKQQILSQNTTDKWTGEGYGGAEANAEAIAKLLADAGITDIKQFGKVDKYEPVDVIGKTYNGNTVYSNGEGGYSYYKTTGETDYEGNPIYQTVTVPQGAKVDNLYGVLDGFGETYTPIDSSKVVVRDGVPTTVTGQTFGNKETGQAINRGSGRWQNQGGENLFSGTGEGKGNTAFRADFAPDGTPIFYTTKGSSSDLADIMPLIQFGLMATGAGGLLGNALLGSGASQVAAGALGGGLLGGGLAAVTGQDVLKGALTGGIGGAISGYFSPATGEITSVPTEGSIPLSGEDIAKLSSTDLGIDYSLANGTGMNPLTDMGGAQGLQAGTSANLANMGGAQGITLNLGPASTTLANALSTFGGMNPANLDAMGGGQGLTYQTPTGVVTQGGLIPTGGMTGNNNVIGETGINTAYNIGGDLGKALAAVDTGVYDPTKGALTTNVANNTVSTTDGLTASQIANLAKAGLNVAGLLGATSALTGGTGGSRSVGALPTQGVPLNTADYFNAIQQNYNRLLPAVPRDVATPLAQWYNSQYGA